LDPVGTWGKLKLKIPNTIQNNPIKQNKLRKTGIFPQNQVQKNIDLLILLYFKSE